jgi:DNA-binding CsgD family transcriptional regulator
LRAAGRRWFWDGERENRKEVWTVSVDRFATLLYGIGEAAGYLSVPSSTLTSWACGYERHALGLRSRRSAVTGPDSLTPTERRVAELAAASLTNRQVAEALFVTVKTVETHLARVYQKLGIATRAELVQSIAPRSLRRLAVALYFP